MATYDISIIIPHLNQEEYLQKCLDSLQQQKRDGVTVEIVVVDNGSRGLPEHVIDKFEVARLITETEPGPGPARNKGVSVSTGKILAFIDADCAANENWIAEIWNQLSGHSEVGIIGGDVRIPRAAPGQTTVIEAYESVFAYRQQEYIENKGFSGTGNLAMRKEVFDAVGPFAGIGLAEDRDWGQRASQMGYRIKYVPDMIVYHPARKTFRELFEKWDRHIAHDFAENPKGLAQSARWIVLSVMLAVSPILEIPRIYRSNRIETWRERLMAFLAVCGVRSYRSMTTMRVALSHSAANPGRMWNREDT